MISQKLSSISKTISYALRHNPSKFGIELDSNGWVNIDVFISAMKKNNCPIDIAVIENIITQSEKKRFEISNGKIRATYGHSAKKINYIPQVPPDILYHGTSIENAHKIKKSGGLKPMGRQYVHLSSDEETAKKVGMRHGKNIVVYKIDAKKMHKDGFKFYHTSNDTTWLCDKVQLKYII